ncbi:MAG: phosphoglucosamine mutase [Deltaproteobacteria bacterium]|nr:phosphoglucosamine mutase [Deltaproteobacteria bacterium]
MQNLFGTDGIRGVANSFPITAEVALALGKAVAVLFREKQSKKIVIGKDTRKSNYMIENAIAAGICSMGVQAIYLGPIPTPGIAFITQSMRADAGIVISASHNPYFDNGIKIFDHDGYKLPDELEEKISNMILKQSFPPGPTKEHIGTAFRVDDAGGRYITYLKSTFPKDVTLEGIKVVIDCAHGAAYKISPTLFEELGATVIAMGVKPNGLNINERCGALHPEHLAKKVLEEKAQLGIALDGDGDRVILIDEKGNIVDGDFILGICGENLKEKGLLHHNTLVGTVMTNMGLESWLKTKKIQLLRTQVGDRYVVEAMRHNGYCLGGEQSGHIIFSEYSTTGDGTLTALRILEILKLTGKSLSELAANIPRFPQLLIKIKVKEKKEWEQIPACNHLIREIQKQLGGEGRLLLRYSGTEPVFRIMIEGRDETKIKNYLVKIEEEFTKQLT